MTLCDALLTQRSLTFGTSLAIAGNAADAQRLIDADKIRCVLFFSILSKRRLELSDSEMLDEAKEALDRLYRVHGWFELRE